MSLDIDHNWGTTILTLASPKNMKDTSMKAPLIAAMLAMFAATASAETPATPLASNDSLSKQLAHHECKYLSKYRIATTALDTESKGHVLKSACVNQCGEWRGGAYTGIRHTIIFGVAY
jgi:hypothetical protein